MRSSRTTNILLAVVAVLLMANLLRPLLEPAEAHAEDSGAAPAQMAAAGSAVWVLKGNQLYYATFEQDFDAIKIHHPEKLDR